MPSIEERIEGRYVEPSVVVEEALKAGAESISYTYTEPAVFYEYALDVASLAREAGLKNVFVSNGYMTEGAIRKIAPLLDAVNVDLKGDDQFYRKVCGAKQQPVKECISLLFTLGVWVEVTTLLIPGYNDSDGALKEIASFLAGVSKDIPWHVSAFHPMYRLMDAPPTRSSDLRRGISAGKQAGLRYVYAGNMPGEGDDTACPCCGNVLIERSAFRVMRNSIVDGRCGSCGLKIAGVW
jgi:pyruvate formate lyase activating enzyme